MFVCTQAAPALALIADRWSEDGLDGYTIAAATTLIIGAVLISAIVAAHIKLYTRSRVTLSHGLPQWHDQRLAKRLLERMANKDSVFHGQSWPHDIVTSLPAEDSKESLKAAAQAARACVSGLLSDAYAF